MKQFFARVVELREEKYVKYDGKVTTDSLSREFLEVTNNLPPHKDKKCLPSRKGIFLFYS